MQKFSYKGRNDNNEKVKGIIDGINRKNAILILKKQGIIITELKEYKDKKKLRDSFKNIVEKNKKIKNSDNDTNKNSKFSFNMFKSKKSNNTKKIDLNINVASNNTNENFEDINLEDLNDVLKNINIGNITKETKDEVKDDLLDIDIDKITDSDFKSSTDDFKKNEPKKGNIFKTEINSENIKKLISSDIKINNNKKVSRKKVKNKELLLFSKKIATLLETGIPITRSLQIVIKQTENIFFQKVLAVVTKDVSQGLSLSQSMSKFPKVFDAHYVALVKTGEDTGELSKTFNLLYEEMLNSQKIKSKVKTAAIYPVVLMGILVIAIIVVAKVIVPMFRKLFDGMPLPAFTDAVFSFFTFFDKNLHWIVLGIFIFIVIFKNLLRNITIRYKWDLLKLRIPVFGNILTEFHTINILRTLDIALKNGLSIVDALDLAIDTTENVSLKIELKKVSTKIIQGIPLSIAMGESPAFPELAVQLINIGEESGKLGDLIIKALEWYEWSLNDFIDKSSKYIEPIAIVFVGIFVAAFVFSIAIPMFDLNSGAGLS